MAISYNKLWKMLIDKNMMRTDMALNAGITKNVLARMSKGQPVSMSSMEKICDYTYFKNCLKRECRRYGIPWRWN